MNSIVGQLLIAGVSLVLIALVIWAGRYEDENPNEIDPRPDDWGNFHE